MGLNTSIPQSPVHRNNHIIIPRDETHHSAWYFFHIFTMPTTRIPSLTSTHKPVLTNDIIYHTASPSPRKHHKKSKKSPRKKGEHGTSPHEEQLRHNFGSEDVRYSVDGLYLGDQEDLTGMQGHGRFGRPRGHGDTSTLVSWPLYVCVDVRVYLCVCGPVWWFDSVYVNVDENVCVYLCMCASVMIWYSVCGCWWICVCVFVCVGQYDDLILCMWV